MDAYPTPKEPIISNATRLRLFVRSFMGVCVRVLDGLMWLRVLFCFCVSLFCWFFVPLLPCSVISLFPVLNIFVALFLRFLVSVSLCFFASLLEN